MLNIPEEAEETKAFWALFAGAFNKPDPPIPMRDTPIYAQLKAEHETVTVEIHVDTTKFVAALKPLLKNRKARR